MRRIALVCFALALAACPGRVQYPECKTDGDCADHGQVCINGFCKECRDDSNCASRPDRPVCRDAICVAKSQCAKNEDCGPGMKCAQDRCVPECESDADCAGGARCSQGRCVAQERCNADADCPRGKACVDRVCKSQEEAKRVGDCNLKPVYFGYDDATLSPDARKALDDEFQCVRRLQFRRLVIAGHTDERGTTEYNLALGERRASAVKGYLSSLGVGADRMRTLSYGSERPVCTEHEESCWSQNRRAHMVVTGRSNQG
jgi:peptidoglycan-associated lipoprotein